jgi:hypothetical protein
MKIDWIHLHLMINHFPVVLAAVGAAAVLVALIRKSVNAWRYATITVLLAGLSGPLALLSGQRAEHEAEKQWAVTEASIHQHEEAAEIAMWIALVAAASAIAALRRPEPKWQIAMAILSFAAAGGMGYAAYQGGKVVHNSSQLQRAVDSDINP